VKKWTRDQIAATIDHAVLSPDATDLDVIEQCKLGRELGVASVCVRPTDVPLAAAALKGSTTVVSAVVAFPHGAAQPETKAKEARLCIADGARELDMVLNIGKLRSGEDDWVRHDIEAVVEEARPHGVLVKVILEVCFLTDEEIVRGCRLAQVAGADFVKSSTGFGTGGATPEAIALMVATVGETMRVKASGGIRTYADAVRYLNLGCARIGASSGTRTICESAPEHG